MGQFTQDKADLVNGIMSQGFREAGLTVRAADDILPERETRSAQEAQDRVVAAERKRARRQAARKLIATKCGQ